ncbi:MAG: hypothetical protein JXQ73_28230 [Phycisphaerae bacterium]|nr:hypothetical protein [Phycisphaerae bacterium]
MIGCGSSLAILVIAVAPVASAHQDVRLREGWRLQSSKEISAKGEAISTVGFAADTWHVTSVPSTVLAALVADGVYPDPYYGDNITKIPGYRPGPWLAMRRESPFYPAWWYRTEFVAPADFEGKHVTLCLDGVNYKANVWLNGKRIADDQVVIGMFRRFEFDVTSGLRLGQKNCLALDITAPGHIPDRKYKTKQLEATTGWDDHNPQPPDLNMGIWRDVSLRATGPVAIRHPYVASDLKLPSLCKARLTAHARLINKMAKPIEAVLSGEIEDRRFAKAFRLAPNETKDVSIGPDEAASLVVDKPRLWWPHPVGPQNLYDAKLTATVGGEISDTVKTRFGIREATTYINNEGWRGYKINGKRILIRGGAWMTCDMLLRLDRRRYDALIRYAREANLNMLRSEGFSIRETEDFYDLCDEYGVMATQQIFGRSIPDEALAVACIEDTMLRIRSHPSLVHFLGHDETFPTETLDKAYRDLIAKHDVRRTYQPHSGAFYVGRRFKTGGTRTGTLKLWTYAGPTQYYLSKEAGAWGFAQSGGIGGVIAPIESMRKMMPADAMWPPWTPTWSLHTVIQGGKYFDLLLEGMSDRYGKPTGPDEFCGKGQVLNYECARAMFEAYARNKYDATGITTWKYDAAWPASPTWQYIDWYLQAGGAYYGAKKACAPLHVQYSYDDHSVWVVNSFYKDFKGLRVAARVLNIDLTEKLARTETVDVAADGKTKAMAIMRPAGLSKTYFLSLTLQDASGRRLGDNFYWLSTAADMKALDSDILTFFRIKPASVADFKALAKLPPVRVEVTSRFETRGRERLAHVTIKNPTDKLAFAVHLAVTKGPRGAEVTPTFWQDNYVALLPGETRTLTATFYADDLGGAEPHVKVDGWNVKVVE